MTRAEAKIPKVHRIFIARSPIQFIPYLVEIRDSKLLVEVRLNYQLMLDESALAALMATGETGADIQVRQTAFRMELVRTWRIPPGSKVLEIGCGQGDMTAALANAVGDSGHVFAVDIAPPSYGVPVTIGDSLLHLKKGPLGDRIDYRLEFDALAPDADFGLSRFDYVVMAHCGWYFDSMATIEALLRRLRPLTDRVCISEWNLFPSSLQEIPHFLAVTLLGHLRAFGIETDSNVQTPFAVGQLKSVLFDAGYEVEMVQDVDSSNLDDGRWEVDACLGFADRVYASSVPEGIKEQWRGHTDVLRTHRTATDIRSLSSFALIARS
jgi:SAM-dependent methyltransferase